MNPDPLASTSRIPSGFPGSRVSSRPPGPPWCGGPPWLGGEPPRFGGGPPRPRPRRPRLRLGGGEAPPEPSCRSETVTGPETAPCAPEACPAPVRIPAGFPPAPSAREPGESISLTMIQPYWKRDWSCGAGSTLLDEWSKGRIRAPARSSPLGIAPGKCFAMRSPVKRRRRQSKPGVATRRREDKIQPLARVRKARPVSGRGGPLVQRRLVTPSFDPEPDARRGKAGMPREPGK